jgi:hypothetical protein
VLTVTSFARKIGRFLNTLKVLHNGLIGYAFVTWRFRIYLEIKLNACMFILQSIELMVCAGDLTYFCCNCCPCGISRLYFIYCVHCKQAYNKQFMYTPQSSKPIYPGCLYYNESHFNEPLGYIVCQLPVISVIIIPICAKQKT